MKKYFKYFFLLSATALLGFGSSAQGPTCPSPVIYLHTNPIMAFNTALPLSPTNPSSTGIPSFGAGLTVMPNISGGTLSPTFYTSANGFYYYWSGSTWVSSGVSVGGGGVNLGGCGTAIFSILGQSVYCYSVSSMSTVFVTTVSTIVADLVPDCDCNFYIFSSGPQLKKYDPTGTLLVTYTLTGLPGSPAGGGYAIVGNNIYCMVGNTMQVGTIGPGSTINFSALTGTAPSPGDWASCAVDLNSVPMTGTVQVNASACQLATVTATSNAPVTYSWSGPGIGPATTTSAIATATTGVYSCTVFSSGCGPPPTLSLNITMGTNSCISVASTSITCANLGSATVAAQGTGPFSYTWTPTGQVGPSASSLTPGTYTITVYDAFFNMSYTTTVSFTSLIPLTGNVNYASSVSCNGASTATANVTNMAGGSGTVTYLWQSQVGGITYTVPQPSLSAGIWSVTVSDVLTGCQIKQTFYISQPLPLNLVLSVNNPTLCAGRTTSLNGTNFGGTPYLVGSPYTYTWSGGPATKTTNVSESTAGTYVYTLSSQDSLKCLVSNTIAVDFIPNPTLSVSHVSICPLETGTLNVSGASTYTWSDGTHNVFMTDNPATSKQYTVLGEALSCTAVATASIILKPVPTAYLNSNSPVCNAQDLKLYGNGGVTYLWSGPLSYTSSAQNPVLSSADPTQSGAYGLTVTAANNCTASTTKTLTVYPTPTVYAQGDTVCNNQGLHLSSSSFVGASFLWKGPSGFSSSVQNPFLNNPGVGYTGTYTVKVTSVEGCTNMATTHVSVTALPIPTITSNAPLCFGESLTLNGKGGEQYYWDGPDNFSSAVQNPTINTVSLAAKGIYSLQIISGPCVNNSTHSVTVFPLPSFSLSSNSPVCETKSLNLYSSSVSNAVSFLWQGPGFTSAQQYTGRDSSKVNYAGIYTLTIADANGCKNSVTLPVTILQNPVLTPISTTVCLNEPAMLSVSGAASYLWQGPGFYQSTQANASIASATSAVTMIYTVTGTAVNSCTSITTASLSTLPLPKPTIAVFPGKELCFNRDFTLEGYGGLHYEWFSPDNTRYAAKSKSLTANSPVYAGVYTLVVTDENNCRNSVTEKVVIHPLPGGSLKANTFEDCVPFRSEFNYYASNADAAEIVTDWQFNNEPKLQGKYFSRDFTIPGDYLISGVVTNTITGCVNTGTYMVHAHPVPVADFTFSPQKPVEGLDEVLFTNTSKGEKLDKFNWYFINNEGLVSENQNTTYRFEKTSIYPVAMVVTNTWGCSDTIVKSIFVEADFSIYVPNVFTPDGDGLNDVFQPVCIGVKLYNMKIFNRWGTLLFETKDLSQGWPGIYNGKDCPAGVYVWKIEVSAINGEMKTLTGQILINR